MDARHRRFLASIAVAGALLAPPTAGAQVSPVPLEGFEKGVERSQERESARGPNVRRADAAIDRPRLVVALLVDQYREEYLDRFRHVWGRGGFARLVDGGARFHDCTLPYALALTAPGHATWLTGTTPAVHGIVANGWYDRALGRTVAAADDSTVRSIGLPAGERGDPASPFQLEAQTVGDVLRATTRGTARVVSLSDKARAAVLAAGKRPHGVYWLDGQTHQMQTSSYYAEALPTWAREANARRLAALAEARRKPWMPALPAEAYRGTISPDPSDVFPHPIAVPGATRQPGDIDAHDHPSSLDAFFDFAESAVTGEQLGSDGVPDLLALSVSITDYIGHDYGPDSPEVLDLAHRVDARLAKFLDFLDAKVGRGRWTLSLTSDHGVAPSPAVAREFEAAPHDSVGGFPSPMINAWIDRVLPRGLRARGLVDGARAARADTTKGWTRHVGSGLVTLDAAKLAALGIDRAQAARVIADSAYASPWLAGAWTAEDVIAGRGRDRVARQVAAGFRAGRSGDVLLVSRPNVFFSPSTGAYTTHGTPHRYDSNVPCVLYGRGIRRGSFRAPVSTTDIAPTIAALLGVAAPAQSEGRVLDEALLSPSGDGR